MYFPTYFPGYFSSTYNRTTTVNAQVSGVVAATALPVRLTLVGNLLTCFPEDFDFVATMTSSLVLLITLPTGWPLIMAADDQHVSGAHFSFANAKYFMNLQLNGRSADNLIMIHVYNGGNNFDKTNFASGNHYIAKFTPIQFTLNNTV